MMDKGLVKIIPNAINVEKYIFNSQVREKIRTENGLDDDNIVIGHVGRFHYAKNHVYMVKIFKDILDSVSKEDKSKYRLMLLGEGELMDEIKALVHDLGIDENIMFMNNRSNICDYYQAMDYFLFPSRYEGLPGTVIEAQAAGLKCLISDTITEDVDVTYLVKRMNIELPTKNWADQILSDLEEISQDVDNRKSESVIEQLREKGFDSKAQAKTMMDFYLTGKM